MRRFAVPLLVAIVVASLAGPGASTVAEAARPVTVFRKIHFPVDGKVSYSDTFGACRDGCARHHEGQDLIGAKLTPLVAAVDGTVSWVRVDDGVGISGNAVTITDRDGWSYVYVHLNNDTPGTDDGLNPLDHAFAPGIVAGAKVKAGALIGWMGDSGNAETSTSHLHFEIRDPDHVAINAYASLRLAQGKPAGNQCTYPTNPPEPEVGAAFAKPASGYWLLGSDGGVFAFGDVAFHGSTGGLRLNKPAIAMAPVNDGTGYWVLASDGGVFTFGSAPFLGSTGGLALRSPIVGMAATPDGAGYWLVAADGGVFSFGDARFHGSTGGVPLVQPIVGMAPTPDGLGYWLLAADGGVFAFGSAPFLGSSAGTYRFAVAVSIVPTPTGQGYWVLSSNGSVQAFGDATDHGSLDREGLCSTPAAVGLAPGADGGYVILAADGSVWRYGPARWKGDLPASHVVPNGRTLHIAVPLAAVPVTEAPGAPPA